MKTRAKVWLAIAASLVAVGCIIFGGAMTVMKWDFSKLSTAKYESNTYEIGQEFKHISITTNTADIVFVPSDTLKTSVSCYELKSSKHSVSVKDSTLEIMIVDTRKWYEHIGINFETPKITVHLPKTEYANLCINGDTGNIEIPHDFMFKDIDISLSTGDVEFCPSASEMVKIKTSTGDICAEHISAGALDLAVSTGRVTVSDVKCEGDVTVKVSTGKVFLTDLSCNSVISGGNTGDISLNNVIAAEKFLIERSTGDVKFDGSDAAEIFVKTDTGSVKGSLLTDKVFIAEADTGNVKVPKTATGGICEITTDTGDIMITVD